MKRIGIDVGGTHTDAVLMNGTELVEGVKVPSSDQVQVSVMAALDALAETTKQTLREVQYITIGTTQFTNAVVQRRHLTPVIAVRLGKPTGAGLPPGIRWPESLQRCAVKEWLHLGGGRQLSGECLSPWTSNDETQLLSALNRHPDSPVTIASPFSILNAEDEENVAQFIWSVDPQRIITLSSEFGELGLIERENASILNAALRPYAAKVIAGFEIALKERSVGCPLLISQNDGTLLHADQVTRFPALTFSSGPTNSIRGAAAVTSLQDAVVIDIGGTTTDIGVLRAGSPRQSHRVVEIETVRTNFRMPDIVALGLGGGTMVHPDGSFGPDSVGFELTSKAKIFGGSTLTLTDIAVAAGRMSLGDPSRVAGLDKALINKVEAHMLFLVEKHVRHMSGEHKELPVIVVGGGAHLIQGLAQPSWIFLPNPSSGLVNAVGASIAEVSGHAQDIVNLNSEPREAALERLTNLAKDHITSKGGDVQRMNIIDIQETQLPYVGDDWFKFQVRAKSPLLIQSIKA